MIPDRQFIEKKYRELNRQIFYGKLPIIPVELGNARSYVGKLCYTRERDTLGLVYYSNYKLKINVRYDLPLEEIEDTIIHEMIHLYIMVNNLHDTSSHGPIFKSLMDNINKRHSRHITISKPRTEAEKAQDMSVVKEHFVCVTRLATGEEGITVCSRNCLFKVTDSLPKRYNIQGFQWYYTHDSFFNSYPQSRIARIFKVDKQQLALHLQGAQLLNFDAKSRTFSLK